MLSEKFFQKLLTLAGRRWPTDFISMSAEKRGTTGPAAGFTIGKKNPVYGVKLRLKRSSSASVPPTGVLIVKSNKLGRSYRFGNFTGLGKQFFIPTDFSRHHGGNNYRLLFIANCG